MATEVRQRDGVIIFVLSGKLIGNAIRDLRKVIDEQLANVSGPPKLLFDFADVTFLDSSGLGTLMGTHVSIAKKGGRVAVIHVGSNIKNLIIRSRLISTFEHFDSEDEAVAKLTADEN